MLVAALLVLVAAPQLPADAASTFTIYGSAFGHGTGMAQWGAYGLSLKGWGHRKILRHYYTGIAIEQAIGAPATLRVGIAQAKTVVHLRADAPKVRIRLGSLSGDVIGVIPVGDTWTVTPVAQSYEIRDADGDLVGDQLWGGPSEHIFVTYSGSGGRVFVPEAGHTYNRGYIEFNVYADNGGVADALRLIAVVSVQAYLYGVAEVPSSWPSAALRMEVDAARTYALYKAEHSGQNRLGCNCAVFATTSDQVYAGWDKEAGEMGERWVAAVDATAGEVVTYQGDLIEALYSASSGGYTEHSENVFSTALPYLRGRCDPGDYTDANPYKTWTVGPIDAATMTAELAGATGDIGTVTGFSNYVRGVSGRVLQVTVNGTTDDAVITGNNIRQAIPLLSTRFAINRNLNITGGIRTKYDAIRCAPGLAKSPQQDVPGGLRQVFDIGAMYRNTDKNRSVWLHGPTYTKYKSLNESAGKLGMPVDDIQKLRRPYACKTKACTRTRFEDGHIYFKEGIGPRELHGPVLQFYVSLGGVLSTLRFPTTDVVKNGTGTSIASFEHGQIRCNQFGDCRLV